jgi:hypothetical protein
MVYCFDDIVAAAVSCIGSSHHESAHESACKKEAFTCAVGVLSRILTIGILVLLRCLDYAVRSLLHLRIDKQSFDYVRTILSHK